MAAAYVGTFGGAEDTSFGDTLTWTTTRTIESGEHVVVEVLVTAGSVDVASISVGSLSLSLDLKTTAGTPGIEVWSAPATAQIASGATVTVTLDDSINNKAAVGEVLSGVESSAYVRDTASTDNDFGTSCVSGTTGTAPLTDDIAIAALGIHGDTSSDISSVDSGFTLGGDDGANPWGLGAAGATQMAYKVLTGDGAVSCTFTSTVAANYDAAMVVYKAAAGGGVTAQTLSPSADSVDGSWTDDGGGTALAAAIDETTASDTDYIKSDTSPSTSGCRVKLATGTDPVSSTGHVIHWRIRKDVAGEVINMTVVLKQGGGDSLGAGTTIATFSRNDVSEAGWNTYDETLSGTEADSITDYSDLYLEFYADVP